mgnify:CR=1 FL=1
MPDPILEVNQLVKQYPLPQGWLRTLRKLPVRKVHAVDSVSFHLDQGKILALVGESGSGKTTTGLCTLGLVEPTSGEVIIDGENVFEIAQGSGWKKLRRKAQMIFQDPYESLNPRQTVYQAVSEPLQVHHLTENRQNQLERVTEALEDAGLKPAADYLDRFPQELSGGQRQRVVIASALVMNPRFLVADEPVSMLDVSIRAEILNLLLRLRDEHQITMLYITHDLASAAYIADQVAVMYLGAIVESGPVETVLKNPRHPYTKALLSVIPSSKRDQRREKTILRGETPNPIEMPSGCRFHPRCPAAVDECAIQEPQLKIAGADHQVACLLVEQGLI